MADPMPSLRSLTTARPLYRTRPPTIASLKADTPVRDKATAICQHLTFTYMAGKQPG